MKSPQQRQRDARSHHGGDLHAGGLRLSIFRRHGLEPAGYEHLATTKLARVGLVPSAYARLWVFCLRFESATACRPVKSAVGASVWPKSAATAIAAAVQQRLASRRAAGLRAAGSRRAAAAGFRRSRPSRGPGPGRCRWSRRPGSRQDYGRAVERSRRRKNRYRRPRFRSGHRFRYRRLATRGSHLNKGAKLSAAGRY